MTFRSGAMVAACGALMASVAPQPAQAQADPRQPVSTLADLSRSFRALAARVSPAVVQVFITGYAELLESSPDDRTGSGVILDSTGYIVTNAHVVQGARRVEVLLPRRIAGPGRSGLKPRGWRVEAQVIGVDGETDLAVLRVRADGLPFLPLGDSDSLLPGQLVLAFGSPLGLDNSVTMGIVSATARQLEPEDPMVYIQTDAPINPGNSGGPLVDTEGRVVGINTLIYSQSGGSEGIGFAAPSNIVRNVYEQIRRFGRVRRGEIGVLTQTVTPELAKGLALSQDWGVILGDVYPDGPGAKAGLQVGDLVLELNGKTMENGRQFDVNLYAFGPGHTVALTVLRGGSRLSFRVPVTERFSGIEQLTQKVNLEHNLLARLAVLAVDLDHDVAPLLPYLRTASGVVVVAASPEASFRENGLLPGDVIHAINGSPVTGLVALRAALAQAAPEEVVVLQIEREGEYMYLVVD